MLLFALIFLWTPPHFWALALFVKTDYAKAGVPMLPVVAGERATRRQIGLYTHADGGGRDRALGARADRRDLRRASRSLTSALFVALAAAGRDARDARPGDAMKPEKRLFAYSILYLFVAVRRAGCRPVAARHEPADPDPKPKSARRQRSRAPA